MLPQERIAAAFEHRPTDKVPVHHIQLSSRIASAVLGREAFVGGGIQQWREAVALGQGEDAHQEFLERSFRDAIDIALALDHDIIRPDYWRMARKPSKRLDEYTKPEGALWVDAVQWEKGKEPSPFQPRETLEAQIETDKLGNVFTEPQSGLTFRLRAFNAADTAQTLNGTLTVTDYQDHPVWQQNVKLPVPAKQNAQTEFRNVLAGRRGFFRLQWKPERNSPPLAGGVGGGGIVSLRCAVIEPSPERDSLFGMNHAFSWEFLLRLSHLAGIRWWRDWSVKWHTVQPEAGGGFHFRVPDAQIQRVLNADGRVNVLLPFPSAPWATQPDMEKIRAQAGNNRYLEQRLIVAQKPQRLEDFAAYVRATVQHYRGRVKVFEILNEPLYTTYAVPAVFGGTTADYIALLRTAYEVAKAVDPTCTIVGGIGSAPDSKWVDEFVEQGGLRWCDVMDLHTYPHRGAPDSYEGGYRKLWERMKERGEAKPIWITEVGFYGDDDPASTPFTVGDSAMTRALRPSELRTSADLVKFAAIFCANGVKKIFYHAGTCSALNQNDAGNIFFEYGGAPRKMFAAQAALARLLGPDVQFIRKWTKPDWLQAFEFRSRGKTVVVLWTRKANVPALKIPAGFRALDLMGNPLAGEQVTVSEVPMYWVTGLLRFTQYLLHRGNLASRGIYPLRHQRSSSPQALRRPSQPAGLSSARDCALALQTRIGWLSQRSRFYAVDFPRNL